MLRKKLLALLVVLIGGGWFVFDKFEIKGLEGISVKPRDDTTPTGFGRPESAPPPLERTTDTIRIASFNIQVYGERKAEKPHVMEILADIIRRFDVVAIQEIRSDNQAVVPKLVDQINAAGRSYDFLTGPRQGRTSSKEQYAYIFDAQSIEVDRTSAYSVGDPGDRLHRPPYVAAFRVRGPPPEAAFTFTLINIHTDPDETDTELDALDDVFLAVRNDGRGEDDIILLGDLNVDEQHLGELGQVPGIAWLIAGAPTNTRGTKTYDNILLPRRATSEFTGRVGVFDIMKEYNLTTPQALEVSDHLPIWAEFSIYESTQPGPIASRPDEKVK